jgi:hypothetical protein
MPDEAKSEIEQSRKIEQEIELAQNTSLHLGGGGGTANFIPRQ